MARVAVVASATSAFVKQSDQSVAELAAGPCAEILRSNPVLRELVDCVLVSSCSNEQYLGPVVSEMLGIQPKLAQRIDNLCNSGTNSIATGFSLIASGLCSAVLVTGAEKRESTGYRLTSDITRGSYFLPVHWAALFAKSYMRKYQLAEEKLAMVPVLNRKNSAKNPKALFPSEVTVDQVMNSRKIVEPLKLLECSSACDGASAVMLLSEKLARQVPSTPVWISGIGQRTNSASLAGSTPELSRIDSAIHAGRDAFEMAGLRPSDVDVAELHDAFSILEIMALEDLGLAVAGKGSRFLETGDTVLNPRGGILGCGHPVGATGIAQVAEIFSQLSHKAGERQVSSTLKCGLVHNLAAAGSSATVMIMSAN
ncbi:MAG: thiolase family protein [Nitrososphaera sp.]